MQYIYSAPEIYRTGEAFIDATRWYWQNEDLYKLYFVSGGGISGSPSESMKRDIPNKVKVNVGQQDKHIPGTNNYKQSIVAGKNRSILSENPQQLLDEFAGTGQRVGTNKERIDFGKIIGQYYDSETGTYIDTTRGMIHYDSKGGAHIVPSKPNGD